VTDALATMPGAATVNRSAAASGTARRFTTSTFLGRGSLDVLTQPGQRRLVLGGVDAHRVYSHRRGSRGCEERSPHRHDGTIVMGPSISDVGTSPRATAVEAVRTSPCNSSSVSQTRRGRR
jgi:hypothetical protein